MHLNNISLLLTVENIRLVFVMSYWAKSLSINDKPHNNYYDDLFINGETRSLCRYNVMIMISCFFYKQSS